MWYLPNRFWVEGPLCFYRKGSGHVIECAEKPACEGNEYSNYANVCCPAENGFELAGRNDRSGRDQGYGAGAWSTDQPDLWLPETVWRVKTTADGTKKPWTNRLQIQKRMICPKMKIDRNQQSDRAGGAHSDQWRKDNGQWKWQWFPGMPGRVERTTARELSLLPTEKK